jgi:hypothetical protein
LTIRIGGFNALLTSLVSPSSRASGKQSVSTSNGGRRMFSGFGGDDGTDDTSTLDDNEPTSTETTAITEDDDNAPIDDTPAVEYDDDADDGTVPTSVIAARQKKMQSLPSSNSNQPTNRVEYALMNVLRTTLTQSSSVTKAAANKHVPVAKRRVPRAAAALAEVLLPAPEPLPEPGSSQAADRVKMTPLARRLADAEAAAKVKKTTVNNNGNSGIDTNADNESSVATTSAARGVKRIRASDDDITTLDDTDTTAAEAEENTDDTPSNVVAPPRKLVRTTPTSTINVVRRAPSDASTSTTTSSNATPQRARSRGSGGLFSALQGLRSTGATPKRN